MSIGGLMRTSVSGMNAQATRLAGVSDNIANANTTGYKRQSTEFSALVLASGAGQYNSGVVEGNTRQIVSQQGGLSYTSNASSSQAVDLAVQGKGMLVVGDGAGGNFLTRAGAFVKNGDGNLVNAGGYILQGYPLPMDDTAGILNGFADLQNVNLDASQLRLKPTDSGTFRVNLPKDATVVPTLTPARAGTATQANDFAVTGYTSGYDGADPATADTITLVITLNDGTTQTPTTVTLTPATGNINDLTLDEVVTQINAQMGPDVASASGGKLVLTAAEPGHSVSMTAGAVNGASGTGTLSGLGALTGTGTPQTSVGTLPGANDPNGTAKFTATDSIVVYDDSGKEVILDIYMTKRVNGSGDTPETANVWEYAVFDRSKAAAGDSPFPYSSGPLQTSNVTFDPSGKLVDPQFMDISIPNGQSMRLDLGGTSQVGSTYQPLAATVNGNPPGNVDQIVIAEDGTVSARFKSGELVPLYKIPLAMVESPDNLTAVSGNAYQAGAQSGEVMLGFGGSSGLGSLIHGALEQSTVDLASELTTMIESQRSYTANSKVFQTGSEILDVLVNLKR